MHGLASDVDATARRLSCSGMKHKAQEVDETKDPWGSTMKSDNKHFVKASDAEGAREIRSKTGGRETY